MDNFKVNKNTYIICGILILIVSIFVVFSKVKERKFMEDSNTHFKEYKTIEKYEANQYIPVYVKENDIVKKYVNDYKNKMIFDIEDAYNTLNKEYREKRFGSIEKYKEYVDNIMSSSMKSMEIDRYSRDSVGSKRLFNVYDKSGYQYIIKENSINDYEIYLDVYTVKIKK